jgi:hypothetical protein
VYYLEDCPPQRAWPTQPWEANRAGHARADDPGLPEQARPDEATGRQQAWFRRRDGAARLNIVRARRCSPQRARPATYRGAENAGRAGPAAVDREPRPGKATGGGVACSGVTWPAPLLAAVSHTSAAVEASMFLSGPVFLSVHGKK